AVSEYLLDDAGKRPKTLFATHFHELTSLSESYPRVQNMRVEIKEWGNSVIFLYNIVEGKSDRSYGIHVAKMAGLPESVIRRAWDIFKQLEVNHATTYKDEAYESSQISFFDVPDPITEELMDIDPESMTPLEALQLLVRLHNSIKNK
ncbi:MAG TPA: hypothetical protein VLA34_09385, partial [Candidatus Krumholzibacterium sp.]|nr:hypothetical protein [Candidatus Krumholzibacterium sp.]